MATRSTSCLLLLAGALGDRFGRRRVLLVGLAAFGGFSVIASQMSSAGGLIALRALMGLGAAPILVLTYSVLPSCSPTQTSPRGRPATAAATPVCRA